ncbi:chromate efflux transporter [Meridianimarinicoccus sp. MJW13]|uniref:chromate efflux transporter n=1 Tax=Meridianimarinicoccus sp. MJW13 TaxID=2720031 RepID=UPI001867E616|nr:chromate efflux transporter [Fluviibacterium sp. MJW13]
MASPSPSLGALWRVFGRIGLLSFGGPAAQIALMHRELVEDRPWLTEDQFLRALSFCMMLPGPEAMQLATYAGWRLRGVPGGLLGGALFVLPGAAVIAALSLLYARFGTLPLVAALFVGIKATVVVIVLEALLRVSRKALKSTDRWAIAGLSFVGIFFLHLPFPAIILAAGTYGFLSTRARPPDDATALPRGHLRRTIAVWGGLWLLPVAALWLADAAFLTDLALFFSKLAVVTFGGAYAVLAYMTQAVVAEHGWISTQQMIDGLGLAETTPGPLILVTQFVGMLAGDLRGGVGLALASGAVVLWVTFVPCFLWIFAGAPYIDWLAHQPRLSGALSAITAAVVGVILNLSVWFALHVLFGQVTEVRFGPVTLLRPDWASFDTPAAALGLIAALCLLRLHWPLPRVLAVSAGLGLALGLAGI